MDSNKLMTRGEFLKLVSTFAFAVILAKVTAFIPREIRKGGVAYGKNTYGGKAA